MEDYIIAAILVCIVAGVIVYLYRAKKRGETCIGCPYAKQCGSSSPKTSQRLTESGAYLEEGCAGKSNSQCGHCQDK